MTLLVALVTGDGSKLISSSLSFSFIRAGSTLVFVSLVTLISSVVGRVRMVLALEWLLLILLVTRALTLVRRVRWVGGVARSKSRLVSNLQGDASLNGQGNGIDRSRSLQTHQFACNTRGSNRITVTTLDTFLKVVDEVAEATRVGILVAKLTHQVLKAVSIHTDRLILALTTLIIVTLEGNRVIRGLEVCSEGITCFIPR